MDLCVWRVTAPSDGGDVQQGGAGRWLVVSTQMNHQQLCGTARTSRFKLRKTPFVTSEVLFLTQFIESING